MEPSTAWLCNMDPSVIDQWESGFWRKNIWNDDIPPLSSSSSSSERYPSSYITTCSTTGLPLPLPLPLAYSSYSPIDQRPSKLAKSDSSWESSSACSDLQVDNLNNPIIPAPTIKLSFASRPDSSPSTDHSELYDISSVVGAVNPKELLDHTKALKYSSCSAKRTTTTTAATYEAKKVVGVATKPPNYHNQQVQVQVQDHVLAERKRREKLTQKFIALSAIVPGLKKMDKASVLEDAIKYLKQLEEKVKDLEEQAAKRSVESAVLVKKSQLILATDHHDHGNSGSAESNQQQSSDGHLPEIEVRLTDKSVLVRMHCENRKGLLVKAISEIENLHLTVTNTSVAPFAGSSLDVTVMAQTEEGFSMTVKDLVKNLNLAIRELI